MQAQVVLTSSQSKRLIAKGIIAWPAFKEALADGIVAISKGTTNSYIAQELVGEGFDRTRYVFGRIAPAGGDSAWAKGDLPDVVLQKGKEIEGASVNEIVKEMGPGDIFLKGANAINYNLDQAAVLIGHPVGGTLGATVGTIISRKVRLVHPAGLEKNLPTDLVSASQRIAREDGDVGEVYGLWATHGELFTEIEALGALFDLVAVPVAGGGIAGAEGAITLALFGEGGELEKALEFIGEIQKEGPFAPGTSGV